MESSKTVEYNFVLFEPDKPVSRAGAIRTDEVVRAELVEMDSIDWGDSDARPGVLFNSAAESKDSRFCVCVYGGHNQHGLLVRFAEDGKKTIAELAPSLAARLHVTAQGDTLEPAQKQASSMFAWTSETGRSHREIWGAFMQHPDKEKVDRGISWTTPSASGWGPPSGGGGWGKP